MLLNLNEVTRLFLAIGVVCLLLLIVYDHQKSKHFTEPIWHRGLKSGTNFDLTVTKQICSDLHIHFSFVLFPLMIILKL